VKKNSAAAQLQEDEYVQAAECGGDHDEEVASDDALSMVANEGQPTLLLIGPAYRSASTQVLSYSPWALYPSIARETSGTRNWRRPAP
jgi:hypothetical protein